MTRTCTVCRHPDRKAIDKALVERVPVRNIALRHGLSTTSVQGHKGHMSAAIEKSDRDKAVSALDHSTWLVEKLRALAETAEVAPRQFLEVADRLDRSIKTYGLIRGEISSGQLNQFFIEMGVRDQSEIRSSLELTRSTRELTPEECIEEGLALVQMALQKRPDLRYVAVKRIEELSGAEVIDTNGVLHE